MRQPAIHLLLLLTGAVARASGAQALPSPAGQPIPARLGGLWGAEQVLGPRVRGILTVVQTDSGWFARVAGDRAPVRFAGDSVAFALPDGGGEFAGMLSPDRHRLEGQWLQPPPAGNIMRFSSTVLLRPARTRGGAVTEWRGTLAPLEAQRSVYLFIAAQADGSVTALLRNPDGTEGDGRFQLTPHGDELQLVDVGDSTRRLTARYDSSADRLTLGLPDLGVSLALARRTRDDATGFYPRTPPGGTYRYRQPESDTDGWSLARASDVGLDETRLAALVQRLSDVDPTARGAPLVHSVLVARHGKLVLDEYFFGFDRSRPHDLRSGSKTFASVLLGIAMDRGAPIRPSDPVYRVFSGYGTSADGDERKRAMTLAHLMTMTSGLPCDENSDSSFAGNEDRLQAQPADWYRYMLDLPLAHTPGTSFGYCSGGVNLVGGIVRQVTGTPLATLFARYVAAPLQFGEYHLDVAPNGEVYLGGGAYLRPRDFLKLGQVYLDGGTWNGRRFVSPQWVEQSTTCQVYLPDSKCADGYDWHLHELTAAGRTYREYEANGNGGQFLIVLPELDLVVVFTAANYGSYGVWRKFRDELVPEYIIAATRAAAP